MTHASLKSLKGYHRVNNTRLFKWRGPKIGHRHESVVVKTTHGRRQCDSGFRGQSSKDLVQGYVGTETHGPCQRVKANPNVRRCVFYE